MKDLQASYLENNALKVDDENSSNGELIFSETSTKDMIFTPHQQLFSIKNALLAVPYFLWGILKLIRKRPFLLLFLFVLVTICDILYFCFSFNMPKLKRMELFLDPLDSDALLHVEGRAQMQSATVSFNLKDISCTYMYRATPDNLFTPAGEIFASFSYAASGALFDTDISLKHTEYSILRKVVHDFSTASTVSSEIKLNCNINFAVSWYYFIGVNSHFFISHAVNVQNVKSHGLFSSSNEAFSTGNSEMNWEPHLTVHPQADSSIHMMHLLLNLRVRSFRDAADVEALLVHLPQLDYVFTLVDRASELKSYFRLSTESLTVDFAIDKPIANIDVRLNCTPAITSPEQVQNTTLDHCTLLSPIDFAMFKAELNQNKFVNITALSLAKSFVSLFMGEYHFVRSIDNAMFLGETFSDDFAAIHRNSRALTSSSPSNTISSSASCITLDSDGVYLSQSCFVIESGFFKVYFSMYSTTGNFNGLANFVSSWSPNGRVFRSQLEGKFYSNDKHFGLEGDIWSSLPDQNITMNLVINGTRPGSQNTSRLYMHSLNVNWDLFEASKHGQMFAQSLIWLSFLENPVKSSANFSYGNHFYSTELLVNTKASPVNTGQSVKVIAYGAYEGSEKRWHWSLDEGEFTYFGTVVGRTTALLGYHGSDDSGLFFTNFAITNGTSSTIVFASNLTGLSWQTIDGWRKDGSIEMYSNFVLNRGYRTIFSYQTLGWLQYANNSFKLILQENPNDDERTEIAPSAFSYVNRPSTSHQTLQLADTSYDHQNNNFWQLWTYETFSQHVHFTVEDNSEHLFEQLSSSFLIAEEVMKDTSLISTVQNSNRRLQEEFPYQMFFSSYGTYGGNWDSWNAVMNRSFLIVEEDLQFYSLGDISYSKLSPEGGRGHSGKSVLHAAAFYSDHSPIFMSTDSISWVSNSDDWTKSGFLSGYSTTNIADFANWNASGALNFGDNAFWGNFLESDLNSKEVNIAGKAQGSYGGVWPRVWAKLQDSALIVDSDPVGSMVGYISTNISSCFSLGFTLRNNSDDAVMVSENALYWSPDNNSNWQSSGQVTMVSRFSLVQTDNRLSWDAYSNFLYRDNQFLFMIEEKELAFHNIHSNIFVYEGFNAMITVGHGFLPSNYNYSASPGSNLLIYTQGQYHGHSVRDWSLILSIFEVVVNEKEFGRAAGKVATYISDNGDGSEMVAMLHVWNEQLDSLVDTKNSLQWYSKLDNGSKWDSTGYLACSSNFYISNNVRKSLQIEVIGFEFPDWNASTLLQYGDHLFTFIISERPFGKIETFEDNSFNFLMKVHGWYYLDPDFRYLKINDSVLVMEMGVVGHLTGNAKLSTNMKTNCTGIVMFAVTDENDVLVLRHSNKLVWETASNWYEMGLVTFETEMVIYDVFLGNISIDLRYEDHHFQSLNSMSVCLAGKNCFDHSNSNSITQLNIVGVGEFYGNIDNWNITLENVLYLVDQKLIGSAAGQIRGQSSANNWHEYGMISYHSSTRDHDGKVVLYLGGSLLYQPQFVETELLSSGILELISLVSAPDGALNWNISGNFKYGNNEYDLVVTERDYYMDRENSNGNNLLTFIQGGYGGNSDSQIWLSVTDSVFQMRDVLVSVRTFLFLECPSDHEGSIIVNLALYDTDVFGYLGPSETYPNNGNCTFFWTANTIHWEGNNDVSLGYFATNLSFGGSPVLAIYSLFNASFLNSNAYYIFTESTGGENGLGLWASSSYDASSGMLSNMKYDVYYANDLVFRAGSSYDLQLKDFGTVPTAWPTSIPTSMPSSSPTSSPARSLPSSSPTSSPSSSLRAPRVINATVTVFSTQAHVKVYLDSNCRLSGRLFVGTFRNSSSAPSSLTVLKSNAISVDYAAFQSILNFELEGFTPFEGYNLYFYVETTIGLANSYAEMLASTIGFAASCCRSISFTQYASFYYADSSRYTSSSSYILGFSLDSLPSKQVAVIANLSYANNQSAIPTSVIFVTPSAFSYSSSSSSLSNVFALSILDSSFSAVISISLSATGLSSSEFSSSELLVTIVGGSSYPPAPVMKSSLFADSGSEWYINFDSATDLGAYSLLTYWPCNNLFAFNGAANASCLWLNYTTVVASYSLVPSNALAVGNNITLIGGNIRAFCASERYCSLYNYSVQHSIKMSTAFYPESPQVVLMIPSSVGDCNNVSISATLSSGHGGRQWISSSWSVFYSDSSDDVLQSYLSSQSLYEPFVIPQYLLRVGTYTLSLTLKNFLGQFGTSSIVLRVRAEKIIPSISLVGPTAIRSSQALEIFSDVDFSTECLSSMTGVTALYSWKLKYENYTLVQTAVSSSRSAAVYSLPSYSLIPDNSYLVELLVSMYANGTFLANNTASQIIQVKSGSLVAVINGGSQRTVAINNNITLDASSSYDENSRDAVLLYSWSCIISSLLGKSCDIVFAGSKTASSIVVFGSALNLTLKYDITVKVSYSNIRSSTATVTVNSVPSGTAAVSLSTSIARIHENSNFSVDGTTISDNPISSSWKVFIDGTEQSLNTNSPTSKMFPQGYLSKGLSMNLMISSGSFPPSSKVTFALYALVTGTNYTSFGAITVLIHAAPKGGFISSSPSSGSALSTNFRILTTGWIADESSAYPLQYWFTYAQSSLVSPLTIQTYSTVNFVSSQFPAGLDANGKLVAVYAVAKDTYGAASLPISTSVSVTPTVTANIKGFFTRNFNSSIGAGQVFKAVQVLNNVASTLNIVNCSSTSVTYCQSLNRKPCEAKSNTCGVCLQGFSGVSGTANSLCTNTTATLVGKIGAVCTQNSNCLYQYCLNGICAAPVKSCPSGADGIACSGHGTCQYRDLSSRILSGTCTVFDTACTAICSCMSGYGGLVCSLSSVDLEAASGVRGALCQGIETINSQLDSTLNTLVTLSGSLQVSYDPNEVVEHVDFNSCLSALTMISSVAEIGDFGTTTSDSLTAAVSLATTVSNFVDTPLNKSGSIGDTIDSAVNSISIGILRGMTDGQFGVDIISTNVRIRASKDYILDLPSATFSPPLIDEEIEYGKSSPLLSFESSFDSTLCDAGDGYAAFTTIGYSKSPYPNSTSLETSLLRFSSERNQEYSLFEASSLTNSSSNAMYSYFISLPFFSAINAPTNMTVEDILASGRNFTFPFCREYDGDKYVSCSGCVPYTYTSTNVTFACKNTSQLCGGKGSGLSLLLQTLSSNHVRTSQLAVSSVIDLQSANDEYSTSSTSSVTVQQYGAIFLALGTTVANVLSSNPFSVSLEDMVPMLALVASLLGVIVFGGFLFAFWDHAETLESELQHVWPPKTSCATVFCGGSWLAGAMRENEKEENVLRDRKSSSSASSILLEDVIPDIFRAKSTLSFLYMLMCNHPFVVLFMQPSFSTSRFVRWIALFKTILLTLFVDTLFFQVFYANDGTCNTFVDKSNCLSGTNVATSEPKCTWVVNEMDSSIGTCSLQVPPSNFTFVITLALLTMIVTIPLDILTSLPLDEYASKRPDWSKWASKSDPYRIHECEEKSLFLKRAKSVKKFEVFLGEAVASTSSTRRSINEAPTKLSVVAEAEKLKCGIQQHFKDIVDHNAFLTQDESLALEDVKRARTEALNSIFHISAQGKFEQNMSTRLSCESSGDYILNVLKKSQESTDQLERTLRKISNRIRDPMFSDEWNLWDKLLLSQFVTEQLSPFKRWILVTKLACFDDYTNVFVHPLKWMASWVFSIALILFLLYWILAWSITDGKTLFSDWGWNFLVGFLQDLLLVCVGKFAILFFIARGIIVPQLHFIQAYLRQLLIEESTQQYSLRKQVAIHYSASRLAVVHFFSPSVRVAVSPTFFAPEASRMVHLLQHLDDYDLHQCQRGGEKFVSWHLIMIFLVPIAFIFCGDRVADVAMDMLFLGASSSILLAHHSLLQYGVVILVVPYILVGGFLLWRLGLFRVAKHYLQHHQHYQYSSLANPGARSFHANSVVQVSTHDGVILSPAAAIYSMLMAMFYWMNPVAVVDHHKQVRHQHQLLWQQCNRPYLFGPQTAAALDGNDTSSSPNTAERPIADAQKMRRILALFVSEHWKKQLFDINGSKVSGENQRGTSQELIEKWVIRYRLSQKQKTFSSNNPQRGSLVHPSSSFSNRRCGIHEYQRRYHLLTEVDYSLRFLTGEYFYMKKHCGRQSHHPVPSYTSLTVKNTESVKRFLSEPSMMEEEQVGYTTLTMLLASLFPLRCRPNGRFLSVAECQEMRSHLKGWIYGFSLAELMIEDTETDEPQPELHKKPQLEKTVSFMEFKNWFDCVFEWYGHRKQTQRRRFAAGDFNAQYLTTFGCLHRTLNGRSPVAKEFNSPGLATRSDPQCHCSVGKSL